MMKPLSVIVQLGVDALGIVTVLAVALSLALPEAAPSRLRGLVSATPSSPSISATRKIREQADCLWLTARNHGFYNIQRDAVSGHGSELESTLWQQFLDSSGRRECGSASTDAATLTQALVVNLAEADRYFRSAVAVREHRL